MLQVPNYGQGHAPAFPLNHLSLYFEGTFAQVTAHSSIFIVWSSFHKLATGINWIVLNGIEGGQKSQVSLY
jgi:hypothetical protein